MYEFVFFSESDVRCNVHTLVFSTVHRIFYEVLENKRMFFGENVGQVFGFFWSVEVSLPRMPCLLSLCEIDP